MRLSDLDPKEVTAVEPGGHDPGPLRLSEIHPDDVTPAKAPSSYEGVPDDDLNALQRLEKKAVEVGLVKPGMEMFSPGSLKAKRQALETAVNDATLGHLPQIVAGVKTGSLSSPEYLKARDEKADELEHVPGGTKAVGHALGALPALAAPALAPAKTALGRVAQAVGTGAAMGAASNPGDTPGELDPLQLKARAKGAAIGAAIGGAPTALVEGAGAVLPRIAGPVSGKLDDMAEKRAVKQAGAMLKDFRGLEHQNRLNDTGRMLLDEGVVTPLSSVGDVAERADALAQQHGEKIGKVVQALDSRFPQLASHPGVAEGMFNPTRVANRIDREVIEPLRGSPALSDLAPALEAKVQALREMGDGPIRFEAAQKIKGDFDKLINWDKEGTPGKELMKQVRRVVSDEIDRGINHVGEMTKFPLLDEWRKAKKGYGLMTNAAEMAADKVRRFEANRLISPSDYGVGGVSALAGQMHGGTPEALVAGAAGAAVNHFGRKYGSALGATGLDALSRGVKALPGAVPGARAAVEAAGILPAYAGASAARASSPKPEGPPAPAETLHRLSQHPAGQRYVEPLRAAAARGDDSYATTYFLLSQTNPEFRAATEGSDDDAQ